MLTRALVLALIAWVLARHVLGANPLAWPMVVFLLGTLQPAAVLLQNHRADLRANAVALIVFAAVAAVWAWRESRARVV